MYSLINIYTLEIIPNKARVTFYYMHLVLHVRYPFH